MGAQGRLEAAPVTAPGIREQIEREPTAFQFFQAVRLLSRLRPDRRTVGDFVDPAEEGIRFSVPATISFPASEIQAVEREPDGPLRMVVNFLGLTGPLGVLPYHYTLAVADRLRERDRTLRDFLDLFHHRIISLFYRAWEKVRFPVVYERGEQDPITRHVADLVGFGLGAGEDRPGLRRDTLLFYAGLLLPQQRSALALEQLLEDFFDVPVEIDQFVGGWYVPARENQCVVTDDERAAGRLGLGALVGDAVWDRQVKARVRIGPLARAAYQAFLPGGSAHRALRELTRFFGGEAFEFELQLVLARDEVPACVLGPDEGEALPLGWNTWIRTVPFGRDPADTVLPL
jgi:type VI secretion system protein ImpH